MPRLLPLHLALLWTLGGCAWAGPDGQVQHLVLGVGVVVVEQPPTTPVGDELEARARRVRVAGLAMSSLPGIQGLMLGTLDHQSLEVAPDANLLIDARSHPDGQLTAHVEQPAIPSPTAGALLPSPTGGGGPGWGLLQRATPPQTDPLPTSPRRRGEELLVAFSRSRGQKTDALPPASVPAPRPSIYLTQEPPR